MGLVAVPGLAPPAEVMVRLPGIIATMKRLVVAGSVIVAGTDAGIGPIKPHDVIRHVPPVLRQLGLGPAEALRVITAGAAVPPAAGAAAGSRRGTTRSIGIR